MSRSGLQHAPQSARTSAATSLHVGPANDTLEREADQAAEQVTTGEHQRVAWSLSRVALGPVQRQCSCGGTCDECKKKEVLQRQATSSTAGGGHAPASVSSVLSRPGSALDGGTRSFMESRFGYDFSRVRIHNDSQAADSARDVSANAYTVGSSVVFNSGKYAPHSPSGRKLLAHELAHVVQQSEGSTAGAIQRQPSDTADATEAENAKDVDEVFASLFGALYAGVESVSPPILLTYASNLSEKYEEAQASKGKQLTQLQLANVLNRIYATLKADESTAERDADGALLWRDFGEMTPWSKQRPHSVSDIPTFTQERVLAWQADSAVFNREQALEKGSHAKKATRPEPPPGFRKLVTGEKPAAVPASPGAQSAAAQPAAQAQPNVQVQPKTADEEDNATNPGSGQEVQSGLAALQAAKLSGLKADGTNPTPAQKPSDATAEKSLLDASAQIWYLSNRMYLLDRTGHLAPRDDAWFDVSSVSGLKPGGIYFLQPGNEKVGGKTINFRYFSVGGGGGEPVEVSIKFPHVLTALIPVLDLNEELAKRHAGVGLIIAKEFNQKQLTVHDLSMGNLLTALRGVLGKLPWAINAEFNRIKENPTSEVLNQALAMGMEYVSKFVPVVGQAAMLYQGIELAAWLGEVGNVAVYARTPDEVDIASQAIARKLAQFLVFEAISRGLKGGLHGEPKLGGKGEPHEPPPSKTASGENVDPAAPKVETPPAPPKMEPETPNSPRSVRKEDRLAMAEVEYPGSGEKHEVVATREGLGRCSGSPCPAISLVYSKQLGEVPEFKSRYEAIRKLGETNVDEATREAAALVHDIEAYKLSTAAKPGAASATPTPRAGAHGETPPPAKTLDATEHAQPGSKGDESKPAAKDTPIAGAKDTAAAPKPNEEAATAAKNAAATAAPAAATSKHAIDDVLSVDRADIAAKDPAVRSRFTPDQAAALDRLQAAYKAYKKSKGADALSPEGWLQSVTSGKPREDAEMLFGESYARAGGVGVPESPIALKDIPRPADYSEPRLQADLATVKSNPSVWERLRALKTKGVTNAEVSNSILNILKGNIGEILARPEMDARLAALKKGPEGAGVRTEFRSYIQRRRPDGGYDAPKLFSDGLLVTEKTGELQVTDVFEVKSGGQGGAEATSQFFEWREGRLQSGDLLILEDGRKFAYQPGKTGAPGAGLAGYVRGLLTAKAHIIAPRGGEHLGAGSSEQVGAAGTRTALSQTASEIEYLARLLLESLPQNTSTPAAPP